MLCVKKLKRRCVGQCRYVMRRTEEQLLQQHETGNVYQQHGTAVVFVLCVCVLVGVVWFIDVDVENFCSADREKNRI